MKKSPFENTPRVEWKHGAWRYRPRSHEKHLFDNKTWYKIGPDIADVYEFLAEQSKREAGLIVYIQTFGQAIDKYAAEVIPRKALATRKLNHYAINRLKRVFGKSHPRSIRYPDCLKYRDEVAEKHGKKSANSDLETLSHIFSKLIEWGVLNNDEHPMRGNRYKFSLPARDRYVEHWEIREAIKVANPMLSVYIPFKLKSGLDKSTILRIRLEDGKEDGIHYFRGKLRRWDSEKRPKRYFLPWDDELRALWEAAVRLHKRGGAYLFSSRTGGPYIDDDGRTDGFNAIWQRFMRKVLSETGVKVRFTEHDLRAKNASDELDRTVASRRLSHLNESTTEAVYRRKPEAVPTMNLESIGLSEMIQTLNRDTIKD